MIINAFQPMIVAAPLSVTASPQTITPIYDNKQLTSYRFSVTGGSTPTFFLFGTALTLTATNGVAMQPGATETFTGPPNAVIQVLGPASGATFYAAVGEGL